MEGKMAFERVAESHGVTIKSYQADNGRFAKEKNQEALSIVASGAHLLWRGHSSSEWDC